MSTLAERPRRRASSTSTLRGSARACGRLPDARSDLFRPRPARSDFAPRPVGRVNSPTGPSAWCSLMTPPIRSRSDTIRLSAGGSRDSVKPWPWIPTLSSPVFIGQIDIAAGGESESRAAARHGPSERAGPRFPSRSHPPQESPSMSLRCVGAARIQGRAPATSLSPRFLRNW